MNGPTTEVLMKLIEDDLNGYFYMREPASSSEIRYVTKADEDGPIGWGWRLEKIGNYEHFKPSNAEAFLADRRVNFVLLQAQLLTAVSTQAAYYRTRTDQIKEAVGPDLYKESEERWDQFGKDLVHAIDTAIRKSKIRLVED